MRGLGRRQRLGARDLALFRAVARTELPGVGPLLRPLTHLADHALLWHLLAAALATSGREPALRAAAGAEVSLGATSLAVNLAVKPLARRTRPGPALVPAARRALRVPGSTSMPSGHAASAFAFATAAGRELPPLRPPLLALASLVAFSRVWVGVHHPGDVVVGALIGTAMAGWGPRPSVARRARRTGPAAR